MRTAISVHVAEILRDAGPKVTLYPSVDLRVPLTFRYRENTLVKLRSLRTLTPGKWVCTLSARFDMLSLIDASSSHSPLACDEPYIH